MVKRLVYALAALALVLCPVVSEASSITLRPGSSLSGTPGGTVGWGYDITADAGFDVVFDLDVQAEITSPDASTPTLLFDFPTVFAGTTLGVDYDAVNGMGLLELILDPALSSGSLVAGRVFGNYTVRDPLGRLPDVVTAFELPFSADVTAAPAVVPEPATLLLCGSGLALAAVRRLRRRRTADV